MTVGGARGARVVCVGMSGLDRIMQVPAFLASGGKVYAGSYDEVGGGPAATASVAVQRLGGGAALVARVGADATGDNIRGELAGHGVDIGLLRSIGGALSAASNVAVDAKGERQITHFPGRGLDIDPDWVDATALAGAGAVLADMGWWRGARYVLQMAAAAGIPTVLDADLSFDPRSSELLGLADHTVFSAAALQQMSGEADPALGLRWARRRVRGPYVGVTVGADGYLWLEGESLGHAPAPRVQVVDTLGAGDVFHGAYALAIAEGRGVFEAAIFANTAAALKCTRPSGRRGIPSRAEVDSWLARQ